MAVIVVSATVISSSCQAQSLQKIWQKTVANEPTLQASRASLVAAEERTNQARGALLPQLNATWSKNQNWRDYQQVQSTAADTQDQFSTSASSLNLTQPLWHSASRHAVTQAEDSQGQAHHQLAATEQDLVARLMTTWFDAMAARDTIFFSDEQIKATRLQLDIFQRGLSLGVNNEVQRDDASSKYEQALAEKVGAESDYQTKLAAIEQLAGDLPHFAPPILALTSEQPLFGILESVDLWLSKAAAQNPAVLAAEQALAAARQEIQKQQAQHQPTVDLVASIAKNDQADAGNFPGQSGYKTSQYSLGVQVSIPLYSGGTLTAKVREAVALASKAEFDLDAARRTAALQVKQAWAGARSSMGKIVAGRQAVTAAKTALSAALIGKANGLKTALEELQAKQQLAAARRDQLRAMYDNIVSFSKLRAATGEANDSFIADVQLVLSDEVPVRQVTIAEANDSVVAVMPLVLSDEISLKQATIADNKVKLSAQQ